MEFKQIRKLIKPHLTPLNLLIAFFILGVILVLVIVFSGKKLDLGIFQREIKLKDENTSLTVKENGISEIETPQKIFQQQWDKDKTENIFDFFKKKAKTAGFEDFSSATVEEKGNSYQITFLLNGQEVTVYIAKDSEEINDIFELINELTDTEGAESINDYFDFSSPSPTSGAETGKIQTVLQKVGTKTMIFPSISPTWKKMEKMAAAEEGTVRAAVQAGR